MKRKNIVVVGLIAISFACISGAQTPSQSARQNDNANKKETMKQCMDKQKASNSGLTQLQMETTCKNEMDSNKAHNEGNDLATGTQSGSKPPQQ